MIFILPIIIIIVLLMTHYLTKMNYIHISVTVIVLMKTSIVVMMKEVII